MPKRKKHPKLPNGYGSIKYLGKGRRNCYAVHPPVTEFTLDGVPVTPKALCYVDQWIKGFVVLTAYKAGTYTPGMEKDLVISDDLPAAAGVDTIVQKLLSDFNRISHIEAAEKQPTFAEVYERFYDFKYNSGKAYSKSAKNSTRAAFQNTAALHDREFKSLTYGDLQGAVDACPLKHASKELIVSLFKQMYAYADLYDLCDKDASKHVTIKTPDDDESGVPLTDKELAYLWQHKSEPTPELLLIMCYSGFRISEYYTLEVNLDEQYFYGGIKTAAGKNRIVPIHSAILPLVRHRIDRYGKLTDSSAANCRSSIRAYFSDAGFPDHTPHDMRHTFSALCERYEVSENDRKRMLGHAFGDVTNKVYGHRTVDDLRAQIEKIKVPYVCY